MTNLQDNASIVATMPVIDLDNAQLSFGEKAKRVDVLKGVTLRIEAG